MKQISYFILFFLGLELSQVNAQQTNIQYIYDDINRLIQVNYPSGAIIQYKYDKVGNREEHKITGNATPPDLTIVNQVGSPSSVGQGGTLNITYLLQNAGQLAAGVNKTKIYINTSPVVTGGTLIDRISHNGIPNGGTNISKSITIPVTTTIGSKYIILVADANSQVTEGNENNNIANIPITVTTCTAITATISSIVNTTCSQSNGSAGVIPSGGNSYTYLWNTIPQQSTATASNLSVGSYIVTVTAQNGCSATATTSITNSGGTPAANYTYTSPSQNVIQFTNTSINAPTSYLWNFGNGFTATQASPSHNYQQSGTYNICLTATNSCGSDVKCQNVQVNNGCDYPTGILVNNIGLDSATVSWGYVPGALSYNLRYRLTTSSSWIYVNNITQQFIKLVGLSSASTYLYQLQTNCSTQSIWGTQGNFNTLSNYVGPLRSYENRYNGGERYGQFLEKINNNRYLIGISENFPNFWGNVPATLKPIVQKVNEKGDIIWTKESSRIGRLIGISLLSNGTFVTGVYRSNFLHIVCMDTLNANILWQRTLDINSSYPQTGCSITTDNLSNLIVSFKESEATGGSPYQTLTIVKMNSSGNILWAKSYIQSIYHGPFGIRLKTDLSNNIFAYGAYGWANTQASPTIIKFDPNGNILWHTTDPETNYNNGSIDLEFDLNNNIYTITNYDQGAHAINKFRSNGALVWSYYNLGQNYGYDLLARGLSILGQDIYSIGYNKNDNRGFIMKCDTSGMNTSVFRYTNSINSEFTNYNGEILRAIDTSLVVTGRYRDPLNNTATSIGISKLNLQQLTSCNHSQFYPILSIDYQTQQYLSVLSLSTQTYQSVIDTSTIFFSNISVNKYNTCEAYCSLLASFVTSRDTICQGDAIQFNFTGSSATNYIWRVLGSSTPLSTNANPSIVFNQTGSIIIELEASNSTCNKKVQKTIFVNSRPSLTSTKVNPTCPAGLNGSVNLTVTGGTAPFTYIWNNSNTTEDLASIGTGEYKVTVSDSKGCYKIKTDTLVSINQNPQAQLALQYNPIVTNQPINTPYTFNSIATSTNSTSCQVKVNGGSWISLSSCNNAPGYSHIVTNHGTYEVTLKSTNVCGSYETIQTIVIDNCKYYQDSDGDSKGNPNVGIHNCNGDDDFVQNILDCNDNLATVYIDAPELCDSLDNNCNNLIDEGCPYYFPPPPCVTWLSPIQGQTNVTENVQFKWNRPANAIKYRLSIGANSSAPYNIVNDLELLDTIFTLPTNLPFNSIIYAKVVPYSTGGNPLGCQHISFTTKTGILSNPELVYFDTSLVKIKYNVLLDPTTISQLKIFGSQTGLRAGTYELVNDTVVFVANKRFRPGEQLTFTSKKEVKTISNQDSKAFSYERTAITPTQGVVNFDSIGTGIILPNITDFTFGGSRMADLNNDGMVDFIHLSTSENKLYIYFRNLNGTFQAPINWGVNVVGSIQAVEDFNGDGMLDILIMTIPSGNWNWYILFNSSNGLYSNSPTQIYLNYRAQFLSATDIDNDGDIDLIVPWNTTNPNSNINIYKNNGIGAFTQTAQYITPRTLSPFMTADIDNDGDQDLLVTKNTYNQSFQIYENNSTGSFVNNVTIATNGDKYIADLNYYNNDENLDMIFTNPNTEIFLNNSGINYNLNNPTQVSTTSLSVFRGDLDGDGDLDIMNGVTDWYSNNGNGVFTKTPISGTRTAMRSFELFDYDNDGDLDQVFLNPVTREVKILRNLSDRKIPVVELVENNKVTLKYQKNVLSSTINATNIKVQGDETGSRPGNFAVSGDLVTFTATVPFRAGEKVHITSKSSVQYQSGGNAPAASFIKHANVTNLTTARFDTIGTGVFLLPNEYSSGYNGANMIDVNKDGRLDILQHHILSNGNSSNYKVFKRNTNGTFASSLNYSSIESLPYFLGSFDLNNDGFLDLIFTHYNPGKIEVRFGNVSGTFSSSVLTTVLNYIREGAICDIDGDGDLDIVIHSTWDKTISIIKNNGAGILSVYSLFNTGMFGISIKLADVDGDGDLDIAYTSNNSFYSTKLFRIYKNDGNGNFIIWIEENNPDTKILAEFDDINGDGNIDIVTAAPRVELYYGSNQNPLSLINPIDTILNTSGNVHFGDIDGDLDKDLFIPNTGIANSSLHKFKNNGDNTFVQETQLSTILRNVNTLDMMDYDNDGDLDFLFINPATGELKVALNNCNYVTTLTLDNSPLIGTYQANQEIILKGNLNVLSNTNVIFKTPEVILQGILNVNNLGTVNIDPNGCN
jgi:YD repeat-containing protein